MLQHYIKIALRSLLKNKIYTAINLSGLAIGSACCLLISLYVYDEISYDKFFDDSERIYRVALERQYPTNTRYFGSSPVNLATTLKENYDEVEHAGRIYRMFFQNQLTVQIEDRAFIETKFLFADNDFLDVFSFDFLEGNPDRALDHRTNVILNKSTAEKYFGNQSAMGQSIELGDSVLTVTGVVADVPPNSHMDFDLLGSIWSQGNLVQAAENNSWINPWLYTYIKLREGADPKALENQFIEMVRIHGLPSILTQLGLSESDYLTSGNAFNYFLQPVEDIHLQSNLDVELQANSSIIYVYLLSAIVLFILLISGINFVNLATARSTERAKEIGVRKVMGSTRASLVRQFLTESNVVSLVALILAVTVVWITLPHFGQLVGKNLTMATLATPAVIAGLLVGALIVGTLAGLYPAFMLSAIKSAKVLKGQFKSSGKGVGLRNFLIVFQFLISIVMISGTLLLNKQMRYLNGKSLGFDSENVLVVEQAQHLGQQNEVFRNTIQQLEAVNGVAGGFAMPGDFIGNLIATSTNPEIPQVRTFTNTVGDDYAVTLGLEIIDGRDFGIQFNDSAKVIINETAAQLLGYADPIGQRVLNTNTQNGGSGFEIVGVVKDYHHHSLHTEIAPMLLFNIQSNTANLPNIAVRISSSNYLNTIKQIESAWDELVDSQPFTFKFMDDKLQNLYQADKKAGAIFSLFTVLAVILACIGLFGMAAYATQQRTKEIGVRKVLGASVGNIVVMLSKDLTKLILIAYLLSLPIVYLSMTKWFENFAYHTNVDMFTLLIAGACTLILAWLTIGYYAIRAAVLNIVACLRTD